MYPDWEPNLQTFDVWDNAPTNRATWPGQQQCTFFNASTLFGLLDVPTIFVLYNVRLKKIAVAQSKEWHCIAETRH